MVTIVTISYNSSKFIRNTIESVLAQSYIDFEYLISDDYSTDDTWEIIKEYQDPRIRAWRNEKNLGEYPNRNKTLFEAQRKYVIWIDGDDILYPHGLEFMVKMFDAFPDSAMALVNGYRKDIVYPYEISPHEIYQYDFLGKPVTHYGLPYTLFKTEILKQMGGFSEKYISGDTFIKRKIAQKYKAVLISDGVSWWRQTSNQASSKLHLKMSGDIENLKMSKTLLENKECPLTDSEKATAYSNLYGSFLRKLFYNYILKMRFVQAMKIYRMAQIRFIHLKYFFIRQNYYFTNNVNPDNPLILNFDLNPFSSKKQKNAYRKN